MTSGAPHVDAELELHKQIVLELGWLLFECGDDVWNRTEKLITKLITAREAKLKATSASETVGHIYSIANDLANKDPDAIGSVSLGPYMMNAITIYQEYLKGDDYERIDWRALNLPTLNRLAGALPKEKP